MAALIQPAPRPAPQQPRPKRGPTRRPRRRTPEHPRRKSPSPKRATPPRKPRITPAPKPGVNPAPGPVPDPLPKPLRRKGWGIRWDRFGRMALRFGPWGIIGGGVIEWYLTPSSPGVTVPAHWTNPQGIWEPGPICPDPDYDTFRVRNACSFTTAIVTTPCLGAQAIAGTANTIASPPRLLEYWKWNGNTSVPRYAHRASFRLRTCPDPIPTDPAQWPKWQPEVVTPEVPGILLPMPQPEISPAPEPDIRTETGPAPRRNPYKDRKLDIRRSPNGRPSVPSITMKPTPGGRTRPSPEDHEIRPPDRKKEKEHKETLVGSAASRWMAALGFMASGLTEADDFISALYQGLPWEVRRWRGRDGVWRDRAITSQARLRALQNHMGEGYSVAAAAKALAIEWGIDAVGGAIGYANRRSIQRAAPRYTNQAFGWQHGQRATKATWEDVYHNVLKAQAREKYGDPPGSLTRWRRVHPETGRPLSYGDKGPWEWKRVTMPRDGHTFIPWRRSEKQHISGERRAKPGTIRWWQLPVNQKNQPYRVMKTRVFYGAR